MTEIVNHPETISTDAICDGLLNVGFFEVTDSTHRDGNVRFFRRETPLAGKQAASVVLTSPTHEQNLRTLGYLLTVSDDALLAAGPRNGREALMIHEINELRAELAASKVANEVMGQKH